MSEQISRKVYFYQLTSTIPSSSGQASMLDLPRLFRELANITEEDNFIDWKEDDNLGIWLESGTAPYKIILGRVRVKNFPRKNSGHNLMALELADDEGLVELTHMIFFSNGIVGVEYNHNGPRIGALREYIWEKLHVNIFFHSIYDGDVEGVLAQLQGLQEITMKVSPSMLAENTQGGKGLIKELMSIGKTADCDMIEIKLKSYKDRSKSDSTNYINPRILALCKNIVRSSNAKKGLSKLEIVGVDNDGQTRMKNLFEDEFVFTKEVIKLDSSSAVVSEDMFKKLKKVYQENENILIESLRISYING